MVVAWWCHSARQTGNLLKKPSAAIQLKNATLQCYIQTFKFHSLFHDSTLLVEWFFFDLTSETNLLVEFNILLKRLGKSYLNLIELIYFVITVPRSILPFFMLLVRPCSPRISDVASLQRYKSIYNNTLNCCLKLKYNWKTIPTIFYFIKISLKIQDTLSSLSNVLLPPVSKICRSLVHLQTKT